MRWTIDTASRLAKRDCRDCRGTGLSPARNGAALCACVCRHVFRECYGRFRACAAADGHSRAVSYSRVPGVDRSIVWTRSNEDYCADFEAAARRALPAELHRIFRFYYILGASERLLAARLNLHVRSVYRRIAEIQAAVGRELALMQPYSLYPPAQYVQNAVSARSA